MKLGSSFAVPAAPDRVFAHFMDPESMRACVPGCVELAKTDDTHYQGRLVNEVAHVRFSAGFTAELTEVSRPSQVRAVLRGEDRRLGSSIKVDAALAVHPGEETEASQVEFGLDVALWGKIGRLGESIVRKRSEEVERQFVRDFSKVCAAGPPGPDNVEVRALLAAAQAPAERPGPDTPVPAKTSWWRRLLALLTGRGSARRP